MASRSIRRCQPASAAFAARLEQGTWTHHADQPLHSVSGRTWVLVAVVIGVAVILG